MRLQEFPSPRRLLWGLATALLIAPRAAAASFDVAAEEEVAVAVVAEEAEAPRQSEAASWVWVPSLKACPSRAQRKARFKTLKIRFNKD